MRLDHTMSRDEIRTALEQAARQTWGAGRVEALRSTLAEAERAIWTVLQVPLAPWSEEIDTPTSPSSGRER